jgi:pimeloyl-ACP methyl ester carboxylesterase
MPWLTRDGIRLHYETHGAGNGRCPVLLTHGMASTSRSWAPNLDVLSRQRKVIAWDMRGHGRSDSPGDQPAYSEAATVADMLALLDREVADRAVLGGFSLGGYMTLAFHLAHRDRVAGLMLFDTGPGFRQASAREAWNARAEQMASGFEDRGLAGLSGSAEVRASAHRDASGLARAARGMLTQADARVIESLPSVSVPALVLVGGEDRPFLGAADYMAAKIPGAVRVTIDGAGHAANLDQPQAFNQAVADFLATAP